MTRRIATCRMCGSSSLERYLDLGMHPPADQFRTSDEINREPVTYYPLDVMLCHACGLSQLGYVVAPEVLYQHDYPYESSTTRSGQLHFAAFAESVAQAFGLGSADLAVDIGSNVGVLLSGFAKQGVRVRGVDPAANIARIAEERGIPTISQFFSSDVARQIVREDGHASVITATNVFAHVDDLEAFMAAIEVMLKPAGVLVIEAPYFLELLQNLEYDTIYHEHLSYLSLRPLVAFFERFSMEIIDVQQVDIHGGSIRIFVARVGTRVAARAITRMIDIEDTKGAHSIQRLKDFAGAVEHNREQLRDLLYGLKREGKRIAAVSAPAKGMTLLNYCRFGIDVIEFATEKSMLKVGRFTPGGHIPVLSDAALMARQPDYALLLAWNFAAEIMGNLHAFTEAGGRFILPIPKPRMA